MFVEPWLLLFLAVIAVGMSWSSMARGRTINCLMGCYWDLLNTVSDAHKRALLDIGDGKDLRTVEAELEDAVARRLPLHAKALERTGERFPHPDAVLRFQRELDR